jgi:prepilin-type N-terminal cleavage/methylation domain-containing protein/prepilin-type processing-associated H-X9-DG protein
MHSTKAFTLVELLVVIGIVTLLSAIAFPVFASAQVSAQRTTALANIAQIGKAEQLYAIDYDETLPPIFPDVPKWPGYGAVLFMIGPGLTDDYSPYLRDSHVWYSPADRLTDRGSSSFVFNEQLGFAWPLSAIARPAEAIYLTDRTDVHGAAPASTYVWWQFTNQIPFTAASLPGVIDPVSVASQIDPIRYGGTVATYLFLDGHSKALQFERTWGSADKNLHVATKS